MNDYFIPANAHNIDGNWRQVWYTLAYNYWRSDFVLFILGIAFPEKVLTWCHWGHYVRAPVLYKYEKGKFSKTTNRERCTIIYRNIGIFFSGMYAAIQGTGYRVGESYRISLYHKYFGIPHKP